MKAGGLFTWRYTSKIEGPTKTPLPSKEARSSKMEWHSQLADEHLQFFDINLATCKSIFLQQVRRGLGLALHCGWAKLMLDRGGAKTEWLWQWPFTKPVRLSRRREEFLNWLRKSERRTGRLCENGGGVEKAQLAAITGPPAALTKAQGHRELSK